LALELDNCCFDGAGLAILHCPHVVSARWLGGSPSVEGQTESTPGMIDISQTSMIAALAAGLISFLSPCVLPLVPGYVSYIAGQSVAIDSAPKSPLVRFQAIALSLCFVLGFATVFVILGASATALGQLLISYRYELNLLGGVVVIGFGLFTLGVLKPSWLQRELRPVAAIAGGRPGGAYLLGMAFAFGWSPCIGPILGTILTVGATSATVGKGVTLLAIYSLGLGIPFVVAAAFTDRLLAKLKTIRRAGRGPRLFAGGVMILMGSAMLTGQLTTFSYWLLETFPLLATIG
jgi:cytochrome c-type biogenesis protein